MVRVHSWRHDSVQWVTSTLENIWHLQRLRWRSMAKLGEAFAHGCLAFAHGCLRKRIGTKNNWLVSKVWQLTQQSKFKDFRVSLRQSCSSHDATVSPLDLATWPSILSNLRTPYPNPPSPCTERNRKWHLSQPAFEIPQAGHCAGCMLHSCHSHSLHGENDCCRITVLILLVFRNRASLTSLTAPLHALSLACHNGKSNPADLNNPGKLSADGNCPFLERIYASTESKMHLQLFQVSSGLQSFLHIHCSLKARAKHTPRPQVVSQKSPLGSEINGDQWSSWASSLGSTQAVSFSNGRNSCQTR